MPKVTYEAPKTRTFELIEDGTPVVAKIIETKYADGQKANGAGPWQRIGFTAEIVRSEDETLIGRRIWDGFWLPGELDGLVNVTRYGDNQLYIEEGDDVDTDDLEAALANVSFAANVVQVVQDRKVKTPNPDGTVTVKKEKQTINAFEREDVKWNAQLLAYSPDDYDALVRGVSLEDSLPFRRATVG